MKLFLLAIGLCAIMEPSLQSKTYLGPTTIQHKTKKDISIIGPASLYNVKAESVTVTGPLTFQRLEVTENVLITGPVDNSNNLRCGDFTIKGPLHAHNIVCNHFSACGPVSLTGATINGDATILGPCSINASRLKTMTITADKIKLENVVISSIIVKKNNRGSGFFSFGWFYRLFNLDTYSELLTLAEKTVVSGDITFESGNGKVIIMPGARVEGCISGATVEEKE